MMVDGRSEHYDIGRRKGIPRRNVIREIEAVKEPGADL
ncbi:hypothetical protein C8D97_10745 [Pleionea mediterranea]|uniref:Uncharacterized protein n=1 Tax=Pleionea mediterranea TaxID=523701 RepID=A0A316FMD4_9GAMM|nr:hypothetical protein C8D97_10745 [Pleionea mediterranea]